MNDYIPVTYESVGPDIPTPPMRPGDRWNGLSYEEVTETGGATWGEVCSRLVESAEGFGVILAAALRSMGNGVSLPDE